ncbi:MAG TPA: hypothetical protein DCZ93_02495 [Elusimicrobia bacterium]|nr:hypothetical protein [Elusimicrobiota bacterium]
MARDVGPTPMRLVPLVAKPLDERPATKKAAAKIPADFFIYISSCKFTEFKKPLAFSLYP